MQSESTSLFYIISVFSIPDYDNSPSKITYNWWPESELLSKINVLIL